jgi:dTDP-4-amino-4,6-dideoxygalactose transaminase
MDIPFNRPYFTGDEIHYIKEAQSRGQLSGDGHFTRLCSRLIEAETGSSRVLLTPSCTAALEIAGLLCNLSTGDEVIMPSFTFTSTANAFSLRGATPVFVDVDPVSFNIQSSSIENAITDRTRAIVVVHYGGAACEMDEISYLAKSAGLFLIEDAAQAFGSTYKGRPLGSIGDFGCYSFHETKNVICGEGGALMVNRPGFEEAAEVIREKGTNRSKFFRGEVDKYTWIANGSSYLMGELVAAVLWAQLNSAREITCERLKLWNYYYNFFDKYFMTKYDGLQYSRLPANGHMFFLLLRSLLDRSKFIEELRRRGIFSAFHYVPLHSSPNGRKIGFSSGTLENTQRASDCLVRLPLWVGLEPHLEKVCHSIAETLESLS